jgi:xylulose-5-phosphate/fructose-6-phosphate phosphoketolase
VMLNDLDRYHLVMDVIDRIPGLAVRAAPLRQRMVDARLAARSYTRDHGEDLPRGTRLDLAGANRNWRHWRGRLSG